MYAAEQAAKAPRQPNLNERLNGVSERLQAQCERIEQVLDRVNGTPSKQAQGGIVGNAVTALPTLPMATVIEHLESVQSRLTELASTIERIA